MHYIINSPPSSIAFYIFGYPVKYYGLFMTCAIFLGIAISFFLLKKKFNTACAQNFIDVSPYIVLFSLLGARIFYILGDLDFYLKNPLEMILINHGGISIFGAIIFAIIFLFFYCKKSNISFLGFCDCLAVGMPLCQSIGRWGNYFNQEAFGCPANGFLKLYVDYSYRPLEFKGFDFFHPTFLYEGILNLILFFVLMFIFLKFKNIKSGTLFSLYLIFYSLIRFLVEKIRLDSVLNIFGFHVASLICIIVFFFGLILLLNIYFIQKKPKDF